MLSHNELRTEWNRSQTYKQSLTRSTKCCRNKYRLRGHLFWDLRPAKIPNNATVRREGIISIIILVGGIYYYYKDRSLCVKEMYFYFYDVTPNKDAAILDHVPTATIAMRRSSIFLFCAVLCMRKFRNFSICCFTSHKGGVISFASSLHVHVLVLEWERV